MTLLAALVAVRVRWQPSQSYGVVGYRVWVRPVGGGGSYGPPMEAGLPWPDAAGALGVVVPNLDGGTAYAFAVSAYDARGAESALSNEVVSAAGGGCQ